MNILATEYSEPATLSSRTELLINDLLLVTEIPRTQHGAVAEKEITEKSEESIENGQLHPDNIRQCILGLIRTPSRLGFFSK